LSNTVPVFLTAETQASGAQRYRNMIPKTKIKINAIQRANQGFFNSPTVPYSTYSTIPEYLAFIVS
jgi:hypothetical protein